jgi:hypothetical protein
VLDKLTVDDFKPAVGEAFALDLEGMEPLHLELLGARTIDPDAPAVDDSGFRSPFALDFRGPAEPLLPQRIYKLEHPRTGPLEIFMVPVGRTADGTDYEVIFT